VLAAEHLLGFCRLELEFERVEGLREVGRHVLAGLDPLDEDADVVDLVLEAVAELQVGREPPLALERLLGVGLVVPEPGFGNLAFELR
jgi:hypothetical protein